MVPFIFFRPLRPVLAQVRFDPALIAPLFPSFRITMEASFWTTLETHPQQAPLGIINLLISRRALMDSISRSLEVLLEMPYTTQFPPGLPPDLEQILQDLHASTERLMDEVVQTNRLLHRLALYPPHALPTQPWLPGDFALPPLPHPHGPASSPFRTSPPH